MITFKRIKKNIGAVLLCASLGASAVMLSSCNTVSAGSYRVYFTYGNGSGLTFERYKPGADSGEALLFELLEAMSSPKKSDRYIVIKPIEVEITGARINDKTAVISYNDKYLEMDPITEIFYRAAVVKTVTQIEGIDKVDFEMDGSIIKLASGISLSSMTGDQFIDDNDSVVAGTDWTVVSLYFADESGEKLIRSQTNVAYNSDVSLESIIVNRLVSGPVESGQYPVIPDGTEVLGVTVNNRTCYVNFNEAFSQNLVNASGDATIYAVVNSLCDVSGIDSVRIMINGSSDTMFHEVTSLDEDFRYESSIVSDGSEPYEVPL